MSKIFDAFLAASVAKIIIDDNKEPEPTKPWPFNYGAAIIFRCVWSMATILYANEVLELTFGLGPNYLSIYWAFVIAWIPLLGGFLTPVICIGLMLLGVPNQPDDQIYNRLQSLGVERCYVEDCS